MPAPIALTAALSSGSPKIKFSPNPSMGPIKGILANGLAIVFAVFFTNCFALWNPIFEATLVRSFKVFFPNTLSTTLLIPAVNPLVYAVYKVGFNSLNILPRASLSFPDPSALKTLPIDFLFFNIQLISFSICPGNNNLLMIKNPPISLNIPKNLSRKLLPNNTLWRPPRTPSTPIPAK